MKHNECGQDEIFVTNADDKSWPELCWKTKRQGNVAYDASGSPLGSRWLGSFPVFAKRSEIRRSNPAALTHLENLNKRLKFYS